MSHLKTFAQFIKNTKLEDLVYGVLKNLGSLDILSQGHFAELTETQLHKKTEKNLLKVLSILGRADLNKSGNQAIREGDDIMDESGSLSSLGLIYDAQKTTLFNFIPFYTADSSIAIEIILGIEQYYNNVQKKALNLKNTQIDEQQKLAESEARYRDLFDNASDLIHIATPEGEIIYVNNAWLHAIGYSHDELKGKSIYSFVAENERADFVKHRNSVISGEMHLKEIETSFVSKSGEEIIVEASISCKYKDGKPEYTRGILRNITTRKTNERQLQFYTEQVLEREENIRQLIQNAPDAVVVINQKSNILLWNPKAEEIFGWKAEEVIGSLLSDTIIPIQYRAAHYHGMNRLLETGEARVLNKSIEITALNKTGIEFYISLTISRARRSGDSAFIAFIRDISEQKKNQQELDKKRLQLEKTNLELEQFAWVASHDLKEPLRKILVFSDLLLTRYDLSAPSSQLISKINDSATRMNELIKGILLYSNISDEQRLFELTDLNAIVQDVLTDLEVSIAEKKARIYIDDLPSIEAVDFQMRQLFQNLISNSLKYTRHDTIPIIDISSKPFNQTSAEIIIKDNGIGFESIYNDKIFQVFQRLTTEKEQEGTGIGLALCKKITQTHGGRITASGEEGLGAVFSIILPYRQS